MLQRVHLLGPMQDMIIIEQTVQVLTHVLGLIPMLGWELVLVTERGLIILDLVMELIKIQVQAIILVAMVLDLEILELELQRTMIEVFI